MKTIKLIVIVLSAVILLNSCTENYEEINTDPNTPVNVSSDLLLSSVTSDIPNRLVRMGWGNGNIVSQIAAKNNFVDFDTYQWGAETGSWNTFYSALSEINDIIKLSEGTNDSYHGIALVMKALVFAQLTDNWGNVPASEATKGAVDGNFTPKYDTQEEVYTQILAFLSQADGLLANNKPILGGDLIYGGNASSWRKLANSLRLRYLLRVSKQKDVSSDMQSILNSGNIFISNDDNASLSYQANSNIDSWFMSTARIGSFDEYSLSKTALDYFKKVNDPRLALWFDKSSKTGEFGSIPNGLNQDNARDYDGKNGVSRFKQSLFYDSKTAIQASIMKYSELQFILAEARQRGFISTGNAKEYYENGIRATMQYWGIIDDGAITNYANSANVLFNNSVEQIMNQKWLATFLVDNQGWYDYRRTGFPSFITPGADNLNDNKVPVRYLYPDNEQTLNTANYKANLTVFGEDNINTKGWWEKGTKY